MISQIGGKTAIPAPEGLAAIGNAWREQAEQQEDFEDLRAEIRARKPRVLDMHFVPQMKLADAAAAHRMMESSVHTGKIILTL